MTGISNKKYNTSYYAKIPIFIKGLDSKGDTRTAIIKREYYIIKNLTAKALISIDILKPKNIDILLSKNTI